MASLLKINNSLFSEHSNNHSKLEDYLAHNSLKLAQLEEEDYLGNRLILLNNLKREGYLAICSLDSDNLDRPVDFSELNNQLLKVAYSVRTLLKSLYLEPLSDSMGNKGNCSTLNSNSR